MRYSSFRSCARIFLILLVATGPLLAGAPASGHGAGAAERSSGSARIAVIVRSLNGSAAAARAVEASGGTVRRPLPIVDGVSASIPRSALGALQASDGVVVSPDEKVGFDGAAAKPKNNAPFIPDIVNATTLWRKGYKGNGITIALLDTGVYAAHPDLQGANGSRVIHCEDFSGERGTDAECEDTFGHGTFMAGLMAGNGALSNGKYAGTAPAAKIVSVKVAGFDGSTDISNILAGIQWIVSHKDQYGIKVLNLSLGSDSGQDYRLSPLDFAAERAWKAGIVTVVSAGNSGPDAQTIHKPADDPYVITVGASNDEGTPFVSDDRIPVFSSRGPTRSNGFVKPDVVAPGVKTISLRSPGSAIDQNYGATAVVKDQYFRGTGTSMSTAVTSGAVALILQRRPNLVPDQVKFRLMDTARPIVDTDPNAAGEGVIDANDAALSTKTNRANQNISETSNGLGSLEADRGSLHVEVVTPLGQIDLVGEFVAQTDLSIIDPLNPASLVPWVGLTFTTTGWDPATWDLTTWATDPWLATAWDGTQWRATIWDGTQWRGTQWRNEDWDAAEWFGTQWRYSDFDGTQWRATTWQSKWYAVAWN